MKRDTKTRAAGRPGFTLVELLIVVVIVGILASVAMAKYRTVREQAYLTTMKSDIENLAKNQEIYHLRYHTYAGLDDLTDFEESPQITIVIGYAEANGWGGVATHSNLPGVECGMYVGSAAAAHGGPATSQDVLTCND